MRRVVIAAVALLVLGCAGWGRDFDARLRLDEADLPPLKIQCDSAPVPDVAVLAVPLVVRAPTGVQPVGELFDHWRRPEDAPEWLGPKRHGLAVDADAFSRTVQGDLERFLGAGHADRADTALSLVVRIFDVRTSATDPGWSGLRGRVASRVVLRAELRGYDGKVLWSEAFQGESEKLVYYFRVVHHETTLSAAYCAALEKLSRAVPDIVLALAARAGAAPAPQ